MNRFFAAVARKRASGGAPPSGTPVDWLIIPDGTTDALVTAAHVNDNRVGGFSLFADFGVVKEADHTFHKPSGPARRVPVTVGGTSYDGSSGGFYLHDFDVAQASPGTPMYDQWGANALGTFDKMSISVLLKLDMDGQQVGGADGAGVSFDKILTYWEGSYASIQINQAQETQPTLVRTEGLNGIGETRRSRNGSIPRGEWLSFNMLVDTTAGTSEVAVLNMAGELLTSAVREFNFTGPLTSLWFQDYLLGVNATNGSVSQGMLAVDTTNAAFPHEDIVTFPPPEDLVLIQSGIDELKLNFHSAAQRVTIQLHDGTSWTDLETNWIQDNDNVAAPFYYDLTDYLIPAIDGLTYKVRIKGHVGSSESAWSSESSSVTVNNAAFPKALDTFESYTAVTYLSSQTNWAGKSTDGSTTTSGLVRVDDDGHKSLQPTGGNDGVNPYHQVAYRTDSWAADHTSEVLISRLGSSNGDWTGVGAACRVQSGATSWYSVIVYQLFDSTTVVQLYKVIAGAVTPIGSPITTPIVKGDRIRIRPSGTGSATRLDVETNLAGAGFTTLLSAVDPGTYLDGGVPAATEFGLFGGSMTNILAVGEWRGYEP